jgi:putative two-component system response regulator
MHQKCVLIIEGDSAQALANLLLLEETGLRVLWARNGWEGLEMAKRFAPDAIVLDVELPEIDGFEICRQLKNEPVTAQIPVIIHTVRDFGPDLVLSLELGAVDFIPKDNFSGPALLAALKALKVLDVPVRLGGESDR